MKRFLKITIILTLSLLITFITFDSLSWYNFGDIPTKVVAFRLILFFAVTAVILAITTLIFKRMEK